MKIAVFSLSLCLSAVSLDAYLYEAALRSENENPNTMRIHLVAVATSVSTLAASHVLGESHLYVAIDKTEKINNSMNKVYPD